MLGLKTYDSLIVGDLLTVNDDDVGLNVLGCQVDIYLPILFTFICMGDSLFILSWMWVSYS